MLHTLRASPSTDAAALFAEVLHCRRFAAALSRVVRLSAGPLALEERKVAAVASEPGAPRGPGEKHFQAGPNI